MSCMPCDSAKEYACQCWLEDEPDVPEPIKSCECMWSYTYGLNPKNPRAARNEENRPDWLLDEVV